MKIVNRNEPSYKFFYELEIGDVFIEEIGVDEYVQMKTGECEYGGDPANAVSLMSGELYYIEPNQLVRLVETELIIK